LEELQNENMLLLLFAVLFILNSVRVNWYTLNQANNNQANNFYKHMIFIG